MDTSTIILALLRGIHVLSLFALFGTLTFVVLLAPVVRRAAPQSIIALQMRLEHQARLILWLALGLGVAWFVAETQAIATPASLPDWINALPLVARDTRFGRYVIIRLVLLMAALTLLRRAQPMAVVLAGVALILQTGFSHVGAMGGNTGRMLSAAEALHLLAAAAWLGGLVPLMLCVTTLPPSQSSLVCKRFSLLGMVSVAVIAITAVLLGWNLIGSIPALLGTAYGLTALVKLGLFILVLGCAALNQFRFAPALRRSHAEQGRRNLRLSVGIESMIGLVIVLAAGFLSTETPAAHEQPLWPLPWRISLDALADPKLRIQSVLAFLAGGSSLAVALGALTFRRVRIALLGIAAGLLLLDIPSAGRLLTKAYPTSFFRSPTSFDAASIVRGSTLYADNCAACHGAKGDGDGPLAGQSSVRPADLTAAHLWAHSDGDLFWWVSNGRRASDGTLLMPGFSPVLSETDRWQVIDFVHANNAGTALHLSGTWPHPIPAPALPLACSGIPAHDMRELRGSVVRVMASAAEGADHPGPIPRQDGHAVIILHLNRMPPGEPAAHECVAATSAAWDAYATLSGLAPGALAGSEFLVDPDGWLRAAWLPDSGRGWPSPKQLITEVQHICRHRVADGAGGIHEHHHEP